ncbi:MAG: sigma-70 family RNA polymerase sigma factor [Bacteroidia bacterium]
MNDFELIKGCKKGKAEAQKQLYEQYGPVLMGICLRYAQHREDAEEIFHDAILKVFNKIDSFKGESQLKTWINRIGVNTALDFLRKKKSALVVEHISDHALEIGDTDIEQEVSFEAEQAMKLLAHLSQNQQIVINMYVIDEMSHREIAQQLNISEEASRAQYSRAKRALANLLETKIKKNEIKQ